MTLPVHLIVQHIVPFLDPRDQWSIACVSLDMHKEFLERNPEFIEKWNWSSVLVRRLKDLEVFLKAKRGCGSISFFDLCKMETFTLKNDGTYVFERNKGRHYYSRIYKGDEGIDFFKERILPEIQSGANIRLITEKSRANREFKKRVDAILKLL